MTKHSGAQEEVWVRRERHYTGQIINLDVGDVELEDGTVAFREMVLHPGGTGVIPLHGDRVILARQYRIAIGREILEIPAGKLEGEEDPAERARHELEEETGYRAGQLISAGSVFARVGYTSGGRHLLLALDLEKSA